MGYTNVLKIDLKCPEKYIKAQALISLKCPEKYIKAYIFFLLSNGLSSNLKILNILAYI
jgi:hypothetical protein